MFRKFLAAFWVKKKTIFYDFAITIYSDLHVIRLTILKNNRVQKLLTDIITIYNTQNYREAQSFIKLVGEAPSPPPPINIIGEQRLPPLPRPSPPPLPSGSAVPTWEWMPSSNITYRNTIWRYCQLDKEEWKCLLSG